MRILGGDCGTYTVIPTPEQVAELRALGLDFFIVGTSYPIDETSPHYVATGQLAAFAAGGMDVSEYQFPEALRATTRPWWVDAELDSATLERLRNALRSGSQGPYTRKGWADENYSFWNCKAEFPRAKLLDARYVHGDGPCLIADAVASAGDVKAAIVAELAMLRPFVPYWGFTEAAITQWHNSIVIAGVNLDLNVMEVEEEKDMQPFHAWDIGRLRRYLIGPFGAAYVVYPADAAELEKLYGPIKVAMSPETIDAFNH